MSKLDLKDWKQATTMRLEGVAYSVETHKIWSNMSAKVVEAVCRTPSIASDQMDCSRLVVMLEQDGTRVEIGPHRSRRPKPTHDTVHQMSFGPPGAQQWGFFDDPSERLRWLVLQFDMSSFASQIGEEANIMELCPRYMFFDPLVLRLVRLIEAENSAPEFLSTLYIDTLSLALVRRLAQLEGITDAGRSCYLTRKQRLLVVDYMRARLAENVRLCDLAELVSLSPAHFCRAFKASVGLPPHAWQLRERVRVARNLLQFGATLLSDLALSIGFADQAHFTRVFTRIVGVSPHAWRLMNCR